MPTFIVARDDKIVGTYPIRKKLITIGRSRDNTIAIANGTISRHHARLERGEDGVYILTDLGSLNGTYVNDTRINRLAVHDGDRICVGVYVITFQAQPADAVSPEVAPPSPQPTPAPSQRVTQSIAHMEHQSQPVEARLTEQAPLAMESITADADLGILLIRLGGVIDHTNYPKVEKFFSGLFSDSLPNLVIDMSRLVSISSPGWTLMTRAHIETGGRGKLLSLCGLRENLRNTFDLLSLDKVLTVRATVEEAVALMKERLGAKDRSPETDVVKIAVIENNTPLPPARGAVPDITVVNALETASGQELLSMEEKIKAAIRENPLATEAQLQQRLREVPYGEKVGRLRLHAALKLLDLDTKLKRYQFFLHS